MAEFYAGCVTAEEMLVAREVLMFFGCQVEPSLDMDSAAARGICRREGVGKVKALEVRTLWLQQVIKAKTRSQDNCADLGTKTMAAGSLSLLRGLNGLVVKRAMHHVSHAVRAETISSGESRKLGASALKVLEHALHEIARNGHAMSGSEKVFRGLEPEQLYAMCANSLQGWSRWKSSRSRVADQHGISGYACTSSKNVVEHQSQQGLTALLESEDAGGVHETCVNPETILSSLLMMS